MDISIDDKQLLLKREAHLKELKLRNYGISESDYDNFSRKSAGRLRNSNSRIGITTCRSNTPSTEPRSVSSLSQNTNTARSFYKFELPYKSPKNVPEINEKEESDPTKSKTIISTSKAAASTQLTSRKENLRNNNEQRPMMRMTRCSVVEPQLNIRNEDPDNNLQAYRTRQIPEELFLHKSLPWVGKNMFWSKKLAAGTFGREKSFLPISHQYNPFVPMNVLERADKEGIGATNHGDRGSSRETKEAPIDTPKEPVGLVSSRSEPRLWRPKDSYLNNEEQFLLQKRREKLVKIAATYSKAAHFSRQTLMDQYQSNKLSYQLPTKPVS